MWEYALRFALGGIGVSLFAMIGELWQPKRFAGIFGAAPSVALGSIALAYHDQGDSYVATEGAAMIVGAIAFFAYAIATAQICARDQVRVWVGAVLAWTVWLVTCALGLAAARAEGWV